MHTLSAIELRDRVRAGQLSATDVVTEFLHRIDRYDSAVGAFLTVFRERALAQAAIIDSKRREGRPLGKLAGVPIAIKDNMHVKGELTTCASKMLVNYRAPFDATVVELLEAEDAIILGKTNLDEFAMGSSTESSALQKTRNPWDLKCSPGGSSGGSAAAVAAGFCPLALGSDTGGSIRQPASYCGIVGHKPTFGRVSRYGLVALGSSMDQIGPLATSARDAALLMEVLGRLCKRDPMSLDSPAENYVNMLTGDIAGLKIGVPWDYIEVLLPGPKRIFLEALEILKQLGCEIVDITLPLQEYGVAVYYIIGTAEASTNLARFDGVKYGARSKVATTIEEVYSLSKEEGFGPEVKRRILLGTYVLSAGYQDAYYHKAQKVRTLIIEEFDRAFAQCDLIATPVTHSAAFEIGSIQDPIQMCLEDLYTIPANLAGLPASSIPSGFLDGRPLGLHLTGPQKQDQRVLKAADAFESGWERAHGSKPRAEAYYHV